ncbi:hypothetical protein GCM10010277_08370 [Streptomyces longisporoflavus]|uniref:hypothetical protein n=1 Tax=Streptomyces longisporoflavus TaxID=28044 RepID=UPI00167E2C25|nr:hypothetical protein [Streptomyces longisporoflavus]GGV27041.1 hypothetical protein GCM10010277_08370 [Streptomyces longisporoflavus]
MTKDDADREPLRRAGIEAGEPAGELGVLPGVREAAPNTLVIADGFSCRTRSRTRTRTRIEQGGTGRRAMHLAAASALGLDGPLPAPCPEKAGSRPAAPSPGPPQGRRPFGAAIGASAAAGATALAVQHRS